MLKEYRELFLVAFVGLGTGILGPVPFLCCGVGLITGIACVLIRQAREQATAERR